MTKSKFWFTCLAALLLALCCGFAAAETGGTDGNITWTLSDDGVLTISGTGAMKDYEPLPADGLTVTSAPWGASARTVVISDGVTSIGSEAFDGCSSLTSVTIPDSVTSIGNAAFALCSSLTSVTIPDSITSIGSDAFRACSRLTAVAIPDGVTGIGDFTFSGCTHLASVTLPNSVTSIGEYAF